MQLSTHNSRRLMTAILASLAIAGLAATQSQAKLADAHVYRLSGQQHGSVPLVTDHGSVRPATASVRVYRLTHSQPQSVPLVPNHSGTQANADVQSTSVDLSTIDPPIASAIRKAGAQGHSVRIATPSNVSPDSTSSGFRWRDAGIGAGAAFGLIALVAGALIAVRKRSVLAHS